MGPSPALTQILSFVVDVIGLSARLVRSDSGVRGGGSVCEIALISNIAQVGGVPQRNQRIACGHELVRHVTLEARVGDGSHHCVPLNFLRAIQFVAAGNAAGMKMTDPLDVLRGWSR